MSNFVTQQGLANALNPYALQTQIPMMPDMSQYALASQIPSVSNFVTSSGLANALSPYAFKSEIPEFPTGGNFFCEPTTCTTSTSTTIISKLL